MSNAYQMGIPCITPEIGGQCTRMYQRDEHKQMLETGIRNVMTLLGILEGSVPANEGVHHYDIDYIYNRNGGIHVPVKKAMDSVRKGDTLSIITNLFGEEVDRVIAPFDGVVIGVLDIFCLSSSWLGIHGWQACGWGVKRPDPCILQIEVPVEYPRYEQGRSRVGCTWPAEMKKGTLLDAPVCRKSPAKAGLFRL